MQRPSRFRPGPADDAHPSLHSARRTVRAPKSTQVLWWLTISCLGFAARAPSSEEPREYCFIW